MHEITFRAMGCQMTALVDADTPEAVAALAQVPVVFEGREQALSRFRADSELNQLNARPGQDIPVSAALWDVVALAFEAWRASEGRFAHAAGSAGSRRLRSQL